MFSFGCNSDEGNGNNNIVIDTFLDFSLVDQNGNDLLNPENANAYLESNIEIYYVNANNEEILVDMPNLDYSKGFFIYQRPNNKYAIRIFSNDIDDSQITTTLVKWNSTDTDTIKCEIEREGDYYIAISKVWYNDVVKWEGGERYFEVVK